MRINWQAYPKLTGYKQNKRRVRVINMDTDVAYAYY